MFVKNLISSGNIDFVSKKKYNSAYSFYAKNLLGVNKANRRKHQ